MIHYFLILKRTGENVYKKCFGKIDLDETIVSGFFSAFFTFTQKLYGADLEDIEFGPYRMLFEFVGNELILAMLFDKSDSIINTQQKLIKLKKIVKQTYGETIKSNVCKTEDFEGLDEIVDNFISNSQECEISDATKSNCISILEKFKSSNEIIDCCLLSMNGTPLTNEINKEFLNLVVGQMDAFWKFKNKILDQVILSYEDRYIILHKINEDFTLAGLFRRNTPIGMATYLTEDVAGKIARITGKTIKME
jgi:predicted regulator of Ras-like GTPase activity (Roadblock/LC7/MglB family)